MAKDKVKVQFKVLKQSADVGGKYYGIIDNSNPVNPTLTMQQIIDFKKLHNYSASQLSALIEDLLQGAAELVARDGQPRNLSSLLKFEARIRGTFANPEAAVTSQNVYVAPRMLKDIKVTLDKGDFEFSNSNDRTDPRIADVALDKVGWYAWDIETSFVSASDAGFAFAAPLVISGDRLCPNGWTADCSLTARVLRTGAYLCNIEYHSTGDTFYGMLDPSTPTLAAINAIKPSVFTPGTPDWDSNAWTKDGDSFLPYGWTPQAGDKIEFSFTRKLSGSEELVTVTKTVTLE